MVIMDNQLIQADCLILLDDVPLHNLIADKILGYNNVLMPRQIFTDGQHLIDLLNQPLEILPEKMLLLVDLMMPEISGLDIANYLAEKPKSLQKRCRLFILSSTIDERDILAIRSHPAIERLLTKPLDPIEIINILLRPIPVGKWGC